MGYGYTESEVWGNSDVASGGEVWSVETSNGANICEYIFNPV